MKSSIADWASIDKAAGGPFATRRVTKNLLKLRSLKGQPHDNRWHEIQVKPNGEAILVG
jgi:hypothetical protein